MKMGVVRDLPTKRNLQNEFAKLAVSRTGGEEIGDKERRGYDDNKKKEEPPMEERDLCQDLEQKRERELRSKLRQRQQERQSELKANYKQFRHSWIDGAGSSSQYSERERRQGYYVRKPRPDYRPVQRSPDSPRQGAKYERKRRQKQYWVPKKDGERQVESDGFVRETRHKTLRGRAAGHNESILAWNCRGLERPQAVQELIPLWGCKFPGMQV